MPGRSAFDDELEDDDWSEEDEPWERDDDEPEIECPYCGQRIHEESQRCPSCEQYLSQEDAPAARKPGWVIAGVILCLLLVLMWLFW